MEQIGDFSDLGLRAATPSRVDSLETAVAIAALPELLRMIGQPESPR
jgi:hypothetical protein